MSQGKPPPPLCESDYQAIESALVESARGRWFLAEYARRNKSADTQTLLEAIGRLEAAMQQPRATATELICRDLLDMRAAIARTRGDVAGLEPPDGEDSRLSGASEELEPVVQMTEKATFDILTAVEAVQEAAWRLRENPADARACDRLDELTVDIYTACSFQDLVGQRITQVVRTMRFIEARLDSMIDIWGLGDLEVEAVGDGPPRLTPDAGAKPPETPAMGLIASFEDIEIVDVGERDPGATAAGGERRDAFADAVRQRPGSDPFRPRNGEGERPACERSGLPGGLLDGTTEAEPNSLSN